MVTILAGLRSFDFGDFGNRFGDGYGDGDGDGYGDSYGDGTLPTAANLPLVAA